jgi:hypothetical protein
MATTDHCARLNAILAVLMASVLYENDRNAAIREVEVFEDE